MPRTREYVGSVSLVITGESLDPTAVTNMLGLTPFQSWRNGELKVVRNITFETRYTEGGWKCILADSTKRSDLEVQLEEWVSILGPKVRSLARLRSKGYDCRLIWFAATDATVSLIITPDLQSALARLGLSWEVCIWVTQESKRDPQTP